MDCQFGIHFTKNLIIEKKNSLHSNKYKYKYKKKTVHCAHLSYFNTTIFIMTVQNAIVQIKYI